MKIPYQSPDPIGTERSAEAKQFRELATAVAASHPQAVTRNNGEETDHYPAYPANFTKGLMHDKYGLLDNAHDYHLFVEAINSRDRTLFDKQVVSAREAGVTFECNVGGKTPDWRGWESPRAGHVFELEGPDPGAVGMSPAPRMGSSELAAEMAEVYALAILRDVPFSEIAKGTGTKINGDPAVLTTDAVVDALNGMPFFSGVSPVSSTPRNTDDTGLNGFERRRREARTQVNSPDTALDATTVFRGSTPGALEGPYISQFLLAGTDALGGTTGGTPSFPGVDASFDAEDGLIRYGSQVIDQRAIVHREGLDYLTNWNSWLDVQNGANIGALKADQFETKRRFITTPRDLATYVHYDALYQAYLNACLLLLGSGHPKSTGFPEPSPLGNRTPFATFGDPHILSLVTEVATRCLKAVRRQKFNYHRRARPEALGGRLSLLESNALPPEDLNEKLEDAVGDLQKLRDEIPDVIRDAIIDHNKSQNTNSFLTDRLVKCSKPGAPGDLASMGTGFKDENLLLPMAFPEGSPMHPAYGAGHATVAGGCVTMLKAFFEMYDRNGPDGKRVLKLGSHDYYVPNADGTELQNKNGIMLTTQGELDKLAANISIGRNMAGVHYYSDYYDSLRMGERIAVGIIMEQAPTYGDDMDVRFDSFDGDQLHIYGEAGTCPSLSIMTKEGEAVSPEAWWCRHTSGEEISI